MEPWVTPLTAVKEDEVKKHGDEKEDKALIKKMVKGKDLKKSPPLTRKNKGKYEK